MIKNGAITLLATFVLVPIVGWAAVTILDHAERLARVEEKEKSLKENIIEIKGDVKYIRKAVEFKR